MGDGVAELHLRGIPVMPFEVDASTQPQRESLTTEIVTNAVKVFDMKLNRQTVNA